MVRYLIPKQTARVTYQVANSTFYGTIGYAETVSAAKEFIQQIRAEMPDATHHVYAFKVGYGASIIEGMSDDGEPAGTAGPPVLAILRGAHLGDVVVVITRYFGGTKLGTGGLVHAYGQAAREALTAVPVEEKISRKTIGVEVPYPLYERVKLLLPTYRIDLLTEEFTGQVTLYLSIPEEYLAEFNNAMSDLSAGQITPAILDD